MIRCLTARWALLLAVTSLVLAGIVGTDPALAEQVPPNQRFFGLVTDPSYDNRVLAVGPFNGLGTNTLVDSTANPDGTFTDTDRFDFPRGQVFFRIHYRDVVSLDRRTCVSTSTDRGTYVLVGGTGSFAGITGDGTFAVNGTALAGRDAAGRCLGPEATPVALVLVLQGVGTSHLPVRSVAAGAT